MGDVWFKSFPQILISDLVKNWVDAGTTNNYGVVLIDKNEDSQSSVPIYAHDDTEKYNYSPELAICQKKSYNRKLEALISIFFVDCFFGVLEFLLRNLGCNLTDFITNFSDNLHTNYYNYCSNYQRDQDTNHTGRNNFLMIFWWW